MGKKSIALKPGVVVAIPRAKGGYYFVLHLASNRFGDAFGIFDGHSQTPEITPEWVPVSTSRHVYTGNRLVKSGHWKKLGHREDLRALFSTAPEIFHSKSNNLSNPAIGTFGSGETAEDEVRQLSEAEATDVGLIQGTYRQIMMEEQLEQYLQEFVG